MRAGSSIVETLRGHRRSVLVAIACLLAAGAGATAHFLQINALHRSDHDGTSVEHLLKTKDERSATIYLAMAAKEESKHTYKRMRGQEFFIGSKDDLIDAASVLKFTRHLIDYRGSPAVLGMDFILDLQSYAGLMAMTIDRLNLLYRQDRPTGNLTTLLNDLSATIFEKICIRLLQLEGIRFGEFRHYRDARAYLAELDHLGCML